MEEKGTVAVLVGVQCGSLVLSIWCSLGKVLANCCKKNRFENGCVVASFDEAVEAFQEEWDVVSWVRAKVFGSVCHAKNKTS